MRKTILGVWGLFESFLRRSAGGRRLERGEGSAKGIAFGREKETAGENRPQAQQWPVVSKRKEPPSDIFHSQLVRLMRLLLFSLLIPYTRIGQKISDISKELTKEVLWLVRRRWQSKKGGGGNVSLPSALSRCMFLQRLNLD